MRNAGVRRRAMWGAIALLLLLPFVAMRFTSQVNWGAEDVAAAAALLIGAGGMKSPAAMFFSRSTGG